MQGVTMKLIKTESCNNEKYNTLYFKDVYFSQISKHFTKVYKLL